MSRTILILAGLLSVGVVAFLLRPHAPKVPPPAASPAPAAVVSGSPTGTTPRIPGFMRRPPTNAVRVAGKPAKERRIAPETLAYASGTNPPVIEVNNLPPEIPHLTEQLTEITQSYAQTPPFEDKLELIERLREMPSPATFRVATQLFAAEEDPELQGFLLDAVMSMEELGLAEEQLAFLADSLRRQWPNEVRVRLVDSMVDLADRRAIPLLEPLVNDPDEEVRAAAVGGLEILRGIPPETK